MNAAFEQCNPNDISATIVRQMEAEAAVTTGLFRAADNVVSEVVDGEAVLLNLKSGAYFSLNLTGTRVWELVQEPQSLDGLHSTMSEEFDVGKAELRSDLQALIAELLSRGLLEQFDGSRGKQVGT